MADSFHDMPKFLKVGLFIVTLLSCHAVPFAQEGPDLRTTFDVPSSLNPVGSGARAIGMGGAFIAVADDATAASWNPAGLTQLDRPEISAVGTYLYRGEDLEFGTNPEADGSQSVSEESLNYISVAYPFNLLNRNMIISLNYQHLFDFYREWEFTVLDNPVKPGIKELNLDFEQSGDIYAIGLAYAVKILPRFSLGFTLNFWQPFIDDNEWKTRSRESGRGVLSFAPDVKRYYEAATEEKFAFTGFNFNIGLLWNATPKLTLGAVFKSPFTADLNYRMSFQSREYLDDDLFTNQASFKEDQELDMPMTYGIGIAYRHSDQFTLSADVSRTHWQDFILTDDRGNKSSPISGLPEDESDIDPTWQVRLGSEYLFIQSDYAIPVRAGLFYDPAPAEGSPDKYFGFSLGTGIAVKRIAFDVTYQYRFGRDVGRDAGGSGLQEFDFSMDVNEQKLYASTIFYF